jgi:hypothetical protein
VQRHVGADARLLQDRNVLQGAVLAIGGDVVRAEAPPETGTPQEVQHGPVFGDLSRSDECVEDDPGLEPPSTT